MYIVDSYMMLVKCGESGEHKSEIFLCSAAYVQVEASPSAYQHIDVHIKGKLDMLQTESDVDEV